MIIEKLQSVNSTNLYIERYIKKREEAVVTAEVQTAGMGTKGRSFVSEKGGLYVSKLTFYKDLPARDIYSVSVNAAMGVVKTLLCYGLEPRIKWPNDIYVGDKKICGILISNALKGNFVDYSVVGIGINVNNEISGELKDIAVSMRGVTGKTYDLNEIFMTLCANLSFKSSAEEYASYSAVLGKKIRVTRGGQSFEAVATQITYDGRLMLQDGTLLSSGEIDLKVSL